eukprot:scaffold25193_cov29-Tisochrysis_lutea.AAC.6
MWRWAKCRLRRYLREDRYASALQARFRNGGQEIEDRVPIASTINPRPYTQSCRENGEVTARACVARR